MRLAAVFDRDYFPKEEIEAIHRDLGGSLALFHIHDRKELENYLLVPVAIDRAVEKAKKDRERRNGTNVPSIPSSADLLMELTVPCRQYVQSQYVGKYLDFMRRTSPKVDSATSTARILEWFDKEWGDLSARLMIVPGKDIFSRLNAKLGELAGIAVTPGAVISEMKPEEIPSDMVKLLHALEEFRTSAVPLEQPAREG